ncbi:hypothetical protein PFISCL1PPCAC_23452, partial [Pristionchus fissidentatus]
GNKFMSTVGITTKQVEPRPDLQHLLSLLGSNALVSLLGNGELDSLLGSEGDQRLGALSDDEDVGDTGGESVSGGVLDVDDVEGSRVTLTLGDDSDATDVTASGDHGEVSGVELDEVGDLGGVDIEDNGVINLDMGVRVSDGTAIVGDDEGNSLGSNGHLGDLAKLEVTLLGGDAVADETALGVVEETESLVGLLDVDDIHESSGESHLSADLSVDLDQALLADLASLGVGQSVLQTVTEEEDEGEGLTELVGSGGGARSEDTSKLVQHPVMRGREALQMMLRSTCHDV